MTVTSRENSQVGAAADAPSDSAGRIFGGRFQVTRLLKRSRGIETFLGVDQDTGDDVVIKATAAGDIPASVRLRLEHEAGILRQIEHDALVPVLDFGSDDSHLYLTMPFVNGSTLEHRLKDAPLSAAETIVVGECLMRALQAAHDHGVLHRDVKPANVMVNDGAVTHATLIDFGLARSSHLAASLRNQPVGTALYMSPEMSGLLDQPIDEPSDLYSVGIVLFECLAGHPPFAGDSMSEVLRQHAAVKPPELRSLGFQIPRVLDEVIQRLLRKDPRDRYQSAEAVLSDLRVIREAVQRGEQEIEFVVGRHDRRGTLTEPAFVGRQKEMARLENHVMRASAGQGSLIVVEAESGGGKTRLLTELAQRLARRGMLVLHGQGLDQVAQRPFQVLSGVVEGVVAQAERIDGWADVLESQIGDYVESVGTSLPELSRALGWKHLRIQVPEKAGETRSLQALSALLDAVGSEDRPSVVILDDCQWADELALKLISHWNRAPANDCLRHVTVVVAFRSEEVPKRHSLRELDAGFHQTLPPFEPRDVRKLAESMAGPLPAEAIDVVEKLADGSPFMASAVLRGLVESGALIPGESGWETEPLALADVQSSHHAGAFLARRIQLLPPDTLNLLTVAAVLGKEFDVETLARVSRDTPPAVIVTLTAARRRHLVWIVGDGTRFAFVHDQVRSTLLASLKEPERQDLHDRAARSIEQHTPDRVFDLAYHYGAAGKPEHALPFALKGAAQARSQNALAVAEQLFRIAATAVTADDTTRCQVAEGLGDVLMLRGSYREATQQFEAARELAEGDTAPAQIEGKLGEVAFKQGDMQHAVARIEQALRLLGEWVPRTRFGVGVSLLKEVAIQAIHSFTPGRIARHKRQPTGKELTIVRHLNRLSYVDWFARGMAMTLRSHFRGMNMSERFQPTLERAHAYSSHAPGMTLLPWYSRAFTYVERSYEIRKSLDDVWGQGQSLHFHGVVHYAASQFDECISKCRKGIRLLERTGDNWEVNMARYQLAASLYRQGKLSEAIEEARRMHESGLELGDAQASGISLDIWARAARGRVPQDTVRTELEREDQFDKQGMAQVMLAEGVRLLLDEDDPQAAAEILEKGHRVAEEAGIRNAWVSPLLPWLATALRESAALVSDFHPQERRQLLRRAEDVARRGLKEARKFRNDLPHALREVALLASLNGVVDVARQKFQESLDVARSQGADYEYALTLRARAQVGQVLSWPGADQELAVAMEQIDSMCGTDESDEDAYPDQGVTLSFADRFDGVLETGRRTAAALTRKDIMAAVLDAGLKLLRAENCQVLNVNTDTSNGHQTFSVACGDPDDVFRLETVQEAVDTGRSLAIIEEMSESTSESVVLPGTRSVLCAPIFVRGEVEACLYATHRHIIGFFGQDEARLGDFVAAIAGAALENAQSFQKLEALHDELFANQMTLEMRVNERTSELNQRTSELEEQRSELNAKSQELERSNEELAQFAYVASHDLKAPLRTVGSYCQLIKSQFGETLEPKAVDFLDRAVSGVERMTVLIDDLLEYSRVNTHQRPFEASDCGRLVERVLAGLKASIAEYEAEVTYDDDLPTVMADVMQIERVFQNLIGNAIKFRAPDRPIRVHVSARQTGDFWSLTIRDNGIGIAPDHFDRIFQIFQRLHGTKSYEGTGIGLAIVKKTIENHGGEIRVESVQGEGSAFHFTLPACVDSPEHELSDAQ